jgi:hypothetical protein
MRDGLPGGLTGVLTPGTTARKKVSMRVRVAIAANEPGRIMGKGQPITALCSPGYL